jgi:crotonobetainyl-CoA:carnitine CoA-transferase CaiB-like acyl-CoA transferase
MLSPHRVIDLTGERGAFAGFMLAHYGADVVLVEPEGGRPRNSLFDAYQRGKRSVVARSAADVARLAATADVVIDDRSLLDDVDLAALREANPKLVTVSITPWGSDGPKADWLATDLTLVASSGEMIATGDADRPPVRISLPQTWCHAGAQGALATMIALEDRVHTGLGQHVDVSAQQAAAETALPAILHAPSGLPPVERIAGGVKFGPQLLKWVHPCADGWAIVTLAFGEMIGPMVSRFMHWVYEEGFCDAATRDKNYVDLALDIAEGREPLSELDRITDIIAAFTATKTKAELLERGLADGLLLAPVSNLDDVLTSPQLAARDFWQEVPVPAPASSAGSRAGREAETATERHPGPIVKASASPLAPLGPAPTVGQHQAEIEAELAAEPASGGGSGAATAGAPRPVATASTPSPTAPAVDPNRRPLEGVKVCDLAWVAAAPLTTKILAYWGATVVRIESVNRPCLLRQALGHRDDIPEQENAITWHTVNANKMGLSLDLSKPEAREVVKDLVGWADIVMESFTPGTMARWGLGYDDLVKVNPDLIMLSSCVMGQTGPYQCFAGFGNTSASVAGFYDITGWPDRLPAGPYMAYTDYTSPRFTAASLLAALDHRRRTGEGQYLDFSQMEAATHFLTPALLHYQRTGEMLTRMGNRDLVLCPHSVYPTHGDDNWIAIACETDDHWRSLAIEMRRDELADLTVTERRAREDELDEIIGAWTGRQIGAGLQIRLQAHGIPAHAVQNSGECFTDPQLVHRNHFQWAPHPVARRVPIDGLPYTLSRSSGGFDWAGPTYGQHSMEVLEGILGYDGERIAELAIAEALE